MAAALAGLGERLPATQVDVAWIFPRREIGSRVSGLAVLVAYAGAADMRRILTLRFDNLLCGIGGAGTCLLAEQATVPAARVPRIIDGVVRRGEEEGLPVRAVIGGDPAAWAALLEAAGGVDGACGE
jgi:hypothetical protein